MKPPAEAKKVPDYLKKLGKPSILRRITEYLFINIFLDLILWLGDRTVPANQGKKR